LPNEWIHPSFGKFLFAGCDIIAGLLIYRLLVDIILPSTVRPSPDAAKNRASIQFRATVLSALHLFNPMVFAISTRGSSESVLLLFVLMTLYFALKSRWDAAAVLLGLSTHWKIYPFVYGIACLGVIGSLSGNASVNDGLLKFELRKVVNGKTIRFGLLSAGTFFVLGVGLYLM
jgi:phosphatidylinositol glycan class M